MNKKIIKTYILIQLKMLIRCKRTANIILSFIAPIIFILLIYIKQRDSDIVLAFLYTLPYIFYCPLSFSWDSSFLKSIILLPIQTSNYIISKILTPILINGIVLIVTLPILFFGEIGDLQFIIASNIFFMGTYSFIGTYIATTNEKYIDLNTSRSKSFQNFSFLNFLVIFMYWLLFFTFVLCFNFFFNDILLKCFLTSIGIFSFLFWKIWISKISHNFEKNIHKMLMKFENDKY